MLSFSLKLFDKVFFAYTELGGGCSGALTLFNELEIIVYFSDDLIWVFV